MGNGRSYRLPGRNTVIADLCLGRIGSERGGNFGHKAGGAQRRPGNNANPLIMSKPELSAAVDANDKVNEFADDAKTRQKALIGNPRFMPVFSTKASESW